jgi:outer membrane protein assembly factor BamB
MKKSHVMIFFTLAFFSLFLAACSGAGVVESWPGVSVVDGSVYLSNGTQIFQVDLASGLEKWRFPAEANNKVNYYAPVVLSQDDQLLVGSYNHAFYSIQPGGAQTNWSFEEAEDRYINQALLLGDQVFAGSADGNLYALDLKGSLRWSYATEAAIWGSPVSDGEVIYVASMDHYIYALDPQTGDLIWKTEDLGGQLVAKPALSSSGVLYIGAFGSRTDNVERSSRLVAVDSGNGQILWSTPTRGWVWSTPVLKEDALYFGDNEGFVYALNAQTGDVLWQVQPDTSAKRAIIGAPVILADQLYVGSKAGLLHILSLTDGAPKAQPKTIGGEIYADLVLVDQEILISPTKLENKVLLAVNSDGIEQWSFFPVKK